MNGFSAISFNDSRAETDPYFYYKRVFLYSLVIAITITLPFVLVELFKTGRPVFLYYGDYNAQQICFYEHCVDMVRSGNIFWDWYTDLGSNFIGSYSYYMLGSPFFYLMCLFPSTWAPYLMAPIFILKYMTAAIFAYAYIKRFVKHQNYAVIGALLYAFCGFQIYNTFFNQFHEVVALFPLLLLGMEELVQNDRRGLFALAVAMNAMCNYFMFVGQVVFCIIYFIFRFSTKSFKITWKKFFLLLFESVLGVMLAAIILAPGVIGLLGNPRIENRTFKSIEDALIYQKSNKFYWQRYGHILSTFFFPPDIPSRVNFFYGHETRWASVAAYVPMFGVSGVFAFFASRKRTWLKYLIIFVIVCSFVPVLNSMFFGLNSTYYARWFYMMVLMMIVATVIMLDDDSEKANKKWRGGIIAHLIGASAIFIPLGLLFFNDPDTSGVDYKIGGSLQFVGRFWIYVAISMASIAILWYLFKKVRNTLAFEKSCLYATSAMIIIYSCVHITMGKIHSWSSDFMVNTAIEGDVVINDDEFFRLDFFRKDGNSVFDNLGLYWGYPSIECFHTVVPASIMEFYPMIGVSRTVGSRAESKLYGLRAFTSVKYSFIDTAKTKKHDAPGFSYFNTQNIYDLYINENYIPMGFAYTEFMTKTQFEKITKSDRHLYLCKYLVVPDDKAEYYSRFMTEVKRSEINLSTTNDNTDTSSDTSEIVSLDESTDISDDVSLDESSYVSDDVSLDESSEYSDDNTEDYSDDISNESEDSSDNSNDSSTSKTKDEVKYENFVKSVEARKSMASQNFTYDSNGFISSIKLENANVVFFSVPFDKGWSATVNGEKAEVLEATYGFMAVECGAGQNVIVFTYRAPGMYIGVAATSAGIIILGGYLYLGRKKKPTYQFFKEGYYEEDEVPIKKEPIIDVSGLEDDAFGNVGATSETEDVLSEQQIDDTQIVENQSNEPKDHNNSKDFDDI